MINTLEFRESGKELVFVYVKYLCSDPVLTVNFFCFSQISTIVLTSLVSMEELVSTA